jgi:hypothetical protein
MPFHHLRQLLIANARATVAAILIGLPSLAAGAGPIVDSAGFEAFTLSNLASQNGWLETPGVPGTAMVQSAVVQSGAKSVQVDRAAHADKRWADPVAGFPAGRFVLIDWDMRVTGTGAETGALGPYFGVEAYDDLNNFAPGDPVTPVIGVLGSLGVDATTGEVLYQAQNTGVLTVSTKEVVFGQWHRFRMLLDFTLHQYTTFFDSQKVATIGFVDHNNVVNGLSDFTDADIAALAAASDGLSSAMTGTAYVDNFRVWKGIPGDFNNDGAVNDVDFAIWKPAFGSGGGADADGDLDSDGRDFLAWQRETPANLIASTAASAVVPEPAATLLAALSALGLGLRRGRFA